jgi:gluconokinase
MSDLKLNPLNLKLFIVMGVAGCGKSTVARSLANSMGGVFIEGDDFHPAANKAKMAAGIPLEDSDRWPWFDQLIAEVRSAASGGAPVVLSCSALKKAYRDHLRSGLPDVRFIYLKGDFETIKARMATRAGHFMPVALLQSQFDTLEEPQGAITLDIHQPLGQMIPHALNLLGYSKPGRGI